MSVRLRSISTVPPGLIVQDVLFREASATGDFELNISYSMATSAGAGMRVWPVNKLALEEGNGSQFFWTLEQVFEFHPPYVKDVAERGDTEELARTINTCATRRPFRITWEPSTLLVLHHGHSRTAGDIYEHSEGRFAFTARYADYLRSETWGRLRREMGVGWKACLRCGYLGRQLHHTSYSYVGFDWTSEGRANLELVCDRCHEGRPS